MAGTETLVRRVGQLELEISLIEEQRHHDLKKEIDRIQQESEEAVSRAKRLFKAATVSCKKPEVYDPSKGIKIAASIPEYM